MRFMMIVKGTTDSEAGVLPSPELFDAMTRYNEELAKEVDMRARVTRKPRS